MKSLTAVRKKSPNYPVEFKIKMVELSHRPEISVAQLAREHGINDNLLFKCQVTFLSSVGVMAVR
ncbi:MULTISPECIES: transposase [Enterobacteriaceae]|nr:transposase family protein [Escherichia coli 2-210-07_S3_C1]SQR29159.1 putative transposase [Escherichia coli]SQU16423.1 putative transposase [Escherichia coli]SRB05860.1 putative transposase [Escherichia coli]VCZ21217.1 Putative transposase (identified by ISEscan HMM) [Escherichia coli]